MKIMSNQFGAFIGVMNSAPSGTITFEIQDTNSGSKSEKGSKLWIILLIVGGVLVLAGVAFYFMRAKKLRQELNHSRESLV
jgi:hypothetical protein